MTLAKQVLDKFESMKGFGRSKHNDKILELTDKYIYSYSTMHTYIKHCLYFIDYCKNSEHVREVLGHRARTLEECRQFVPDWLNTRKNLSAYTQKLERSALVKLYQDKSILDIETSTAKRTDIKRSRNDVVRDKHFSEERNSELINFCRCVGPRRFELEKMTAADLKLINNEYFVEIRGKGGKIRMAPVIGSDEEIRRAILYIRGLNGHNHIHNACDVHAYRSDYATRIYDMYKNPIEALRGARINYTSLTGKTDKDNNIIYKSALYYCRGDRKGDVLDRAAMIRASIALGHNRETVVAEHYIKIK